MTVILYRYLDMTQCNGSKICFDAKGEKVIPLEMQFSNVITFNGEQSHI